MRTRRGQSLVEMGLFLMLILFILAAAVDFGLGYLSYVDIRDAAQEGAIYGATHPADHAGIECRVRHYTDDHACGYNGPDKPAPVNLWDTTNVKVTVTTSLGTDPNMPIEVKVSYNYPILLPFINLVIGNNPTCGSCIPLTARADAVILTDH